MFISVRLHFFPCLLASTLKQCKKLSLKAIALQNAQTKVHHCTLYVQSVSNNFSWIGKTFSNMPQVKTFFYRLLFEGVANCLCIRLFDAWLRLILSWCYSFALALKLCLITISISSGCSVVGYMKNVVAHDMDTNVLITEEAWGLFHLWWFNVFAVIFHPRLDAFQIFK